MCPVKGLKKRLNKEGCNGPPDVLRLLCDVDSVELSERSVVFENGSCLFVVGS